MDEDLIAVGSGFKSKNSRSKESTKMLTYALTNFDLVKITEANKPFQKIDVWLGKEDTLLTFIQMKTFTKLLKKAKEKIIKGFFKLRWSCRSTNI